MISGGTGGRHDLRENLADTAPPLLQSADFQSIFVVAP